MAGGISPYPMRLIFYILLQTKDADKVKKIASRFLLHTSYEIKKNGIKFMSNLKLKIKSYLILRRV